MATFKLMGRRQVSSGSGGYSLTAEFYPLTITLPDPLMVAEDAAELHLQEHRQRLKRGIDAEGRQHTPSATTIKIRQASIDPPAKPRTNRYQKRYRGGGSQGGAVFFVDSGYLVDGLQVKVGGKTTKAASVVPPTGRRVACIILGRTNRPVFGIRENLLSEALRRHTDSAVHRTENPPPAARRVRKKR